MLAYIVRLATLTLCAVSMPAVARAWTEAQVTSVSAVLDLSEPKRGSVELEVGVRVAAGWLARFELLDLDEDLDASQIAAEFQDLEGRLYSPAISVPKPGLVLLEFADKHSAPRRGDYRLYVRYAKLGWRQEGSTRVSSWSLPRWPVRLSDVFIRVLAPNGTRPAHLQDRESSGDEVSLRERNGGVELEFRRVELPRTQSFSVSFELPQLATATQHFKLEPWREPDRRAFLLGLALAALWLAKRKATLAACRAADLRAQPLIRVASTRLRSGLSFALCAGAVPCFAELPVLAAIGGVLGAALSIDVGVSPQTPTRSSANDAQQTFGGIKLAANWLDITAPAGFCACVAYYACMAWLYPQAAAAVLCVAWLSAPVFFTATRAARTRRAAATLETRPAASRSASVAVPVESCLAENDQPAEQAAIARRARPVGHAHGAHRGRGASAPKPYPAFLRSSSTTVSSSLSSRPTTSGCGSKSTSAACSSS
jgi:hypothetical protein